MLLSGTMGVAMDAEMSHLAGFTLSFPGDYLATPSSPDDHENLKEEAPLGFLKT